MQCSAHQTNTALASGFTPETDSDREACRLMGSSLGAVPEGCEKGRTGQGKKLTHDRAANPKAQPVLQGPLKLDGPQQVFHSLRSGICFSLYHPSLAIACPGKGLGLWDRSGSSLQQKEVPDGGDGSEPPRADGPSSWQGTQQPSS